MNNFGFPPGVEFPVCLRSYENQEGVEQILKRMTLEEINSMSENTQQKAEVFLESVSLDWNREIATATFRIEDSLTQHSVALPIMIAVTGYGHTLNHTVHDAYLELTRILRELTASCNDHKGPYRGYHYAGSGATPGKQKPHM